MSIFEVVVAMCLAIVTLCTVAVTASYLERHPVRECVCPIETVITEGQPEGTHFGWLKKRVGQ